MPPHRTTDGFVPRQTHALNDAFRSCAIGVSDQDRLSRGVALPAETILKRGIRQSERDGILSSSCATHMAEVCRLAPIWDKRVLSLLPNDPVVPFERIQDTHWQTQQWNVDEREGSRLFLAA